MRNLAKTMEAGQKATAKYCSEGFVRGFLSGLSQRRILLNNGRCGLKKHKEEGRVAPSVHIEPSSTADCV